MVIAWLGFAVAQQAAPSIPHERYELPNGLDLVLVHDPSSPLVAVDLWYHVGSRDEEPGRTGFAHLFEHLMFQGSPSQPDEFFGPLEAVGAQINGSTNPDRTNYFEVVPPEALSLALFLEADRMAGLLEVLDQTKLDNQREVVRNERRQRIENIPYGDARILLSASLFPAGHGYHHPTIGSHADLEAATVEDVSAFFRRWYGPENAVLVVAGNFDRLAALQLVDRYFAPIPRASEAPVPVAAPAVPQLTSDIEIRRYRQVPLRKVWLAWHTPAANSVTEAELDLLASVLAAGRDGRLVQELVEKRGIAQDVTAVAQSGLWSGQFVITATAAPGHDTDELVAAIDEVLGDVLDSRGPTDGELAAAIASFEFDYRAGLETVLGRAEAVQRCVRLSGTPDCIAADLARYGAATPGSVVEAGRAWLETPRVSLHIVPEADRPAPPERPAPTRRGGR